MDPKPDQNQASVASELFHDLSASFSRDLSPRSQESREKYLELIKDGNVPHVVIISGLPGAGKTTLYNFLASDEDKRYTPATRFMPRKNRPSDTVGDVPWPLASQGTEGADDASAFGSGISASAHPEFGPESVIFANHKYAGYYGFPGKDLLVQLQKNETPVMFVTSYSEMTPLVEGLNNVLPLLPVVTLRMEVPHEILPGRLHQRVEAHPGELQERVRKLDQLAREDLLQTPKLHKVYGTRVVWNVTPSEIESYGYFSDQIKPVADEDLRAMMKEAREAVTQRSQSQASDILRTRELHYGSELIPDSLVEVLDNILLPTANRLAPGDASLSSQCPIVIKAGLAAAIYLEDAARVVSPDIDFTMPESVHSDKRMELLMEELGGGVLPDWDDGWNKAVYHCRGLKGSANASDGTEVELDALLKTRVQPEAEGFVFNFTHDDHDLFFRRTVVTPAGNSFPMIPPEQLAIEKLCAGRGPDIDKFDLFDAAGLISRYDFNPNLVRKMIEQQTFDVNLDSAAAQLLEEDEFVLSPSLLETLGIRSPQVVETIQQLGSLIDDDDRILPSNARTLTITALKQLAFVDLVLRSLDKIEKEMDLECYPVNGKVVSLAQQFDKIAILTGVSRLRNQLLLHAEYYVGSGDAFVNREADNKNVQQKFFSKLDVQRERLGYFHSDVRSTELD